MKYFIDTHDRNGPTSISKTNWVTSRRLSGEDRLNSISFAVHLR
jgi:hypothetical protein